MYCKLYYPPCSGIFYVGDPCYEGKIYKQNNFQIMFYSDVRNFSASKLILNSNRMQKSLFMKVNSKK